MTTTSAAPAIAVRGVSHHYEGAPNAGGGWSLRAPQASLHALDRVDLTIEEGEFVSLLGPSGCGKSTLLRAVAGLLDPAVGSIEVLSGSREAARRAGVFGLISQESGLLPWLSVEDNVRLSLKLTGREAETSALLERVGIERFARYHPAQLSGGMRQRVALARALAHGPRVLLMDEPFGALDELSREELRLELLEIWERERVSVLFVTHSVREAVLLSDRVVVMSPRPGRPVADVAIDLSRPRSEALEESPRFLELVNELRGVLRSAISDASDGSP